MIIGIDEVGRGCWAGPLVAGAVLLCKPIPGLADSKKLSAKKREMLSEQILASAVFGIGWVTSHEVDTLGLSKSVELAMRRAVEQINYKEHDIVIDGNINYLPDFENTSCLIKADDTIEAVSAASIIAKVARDKFMKKLSLEYPKYGFESHVGYGTLQHQSALNKYGITSLHRRTFAPVRNRLRYNS